MSAVRLNRYLALAGLGTRRSVERLIGSGRIAVDGEPARDPGIRVEPGASVTLDGNPLELREACGVLVRLQGGAIPALAHPAALHLAGRSERRGTAVLLSDEALAARLLAQGYDPRVLVDEGLEPGAFRPLSPAEMEAARVYARRGSSH
jgi:16S rRNA U516 pseudouridylate synthase RsuA-like enzyme